MTDAFNPCVEEEDYPEELMPILGPYKTNLLNLGGRD